MKKFVGKVVAVDVDLTFVDSGRAWLDWCQKKNWSAYERVSATTESADALLLRSDQILPSLL